MRPDDTLPIEFEKLSGLVSYVHRISPNEYHASCPVCGGSPHQDGTPPDRFVMLLRGRKGTPTAFCRKNDCRWWEAVRGEFTPEQKEQWRLQQIAANEERAAYHAAQLEKALTQLELLNSEKHWETYLNELRENANGQQYWRAAGINDEYFWNYWALGCDVRRDTVTIPVRNLKGEIVNIKHRRLDGGYPKYYMEYKTQQEPVFIANLDLDPTDARTPVIIAEGEKKAAVSFITLDSLKWQVFGLPATPSQTMLESIPANKIYYIGDPDVFKSTRTKQGRLIPAPIERIKEAYKGRELHILQLPAKVDDLIVQGFIVRDDLRNLISNSRRM